jgi:hypothetical protein
MLRLAMQNSLFRWMGIIVACCGTAWGQAPAEATIDPVSTLVEQCADAKVDPDFLEACYAVVREDALRHPINAALPADFFYWLGATSQLRDDAYLAIASVGPKVALNLQMLRSFDERAMKKNPSLAVAFAAAWSGGSDSTPAWFWTDEWLIAGRAVPSMEESFQYYAKTARDLRASLEDVPWQVLAHLADSSVPIEERDWAVNQFGERRTEGLRDLFGAVPYTLDPQRGSEPCTLESFVKIGGPCTHNVQFAAGVFDAFGLPSGWAGGPGHTYPYWFELQGKTLSVHRTNELGNRNGLIRNPLGPNQVWEDELRLLVEAMNFSVKKQRRAALAAWAYGRVPEEARGPASTILLTALRENPYCDEALSALEDATIQRHLSPADAGEAWAFVGKELVERPFVLIPILDRVLPSVDAAEPRFDGEQALLNRLERAWKKGASPEGMAELPFLRARCLAASGKHTEAVRVLEEIAEQSVARDSSHFARAVDSLASVLGKSAPSDEQLDGLRAMLKLAKPNSKADASIVQRSRFHIVRKLVKALLLLDRKEEADALWYAELLAAREISAVDASEAILIGGSGGGPFQDAPEAAELIGLRVSTTGFNGKSVVGSVQGIFRVDGAEVLGTRAGQERSGSIELRVPDGWRVAGMVAAGSDRFDGFQLVYLPQDATDKRVRMSAWVGSHTDREVLIGDRTTRVIGICGRAGADVDSFGLLTAP